MARYTGTVSTSRAPDEVFDYLANFSSVAEWDPGVKQAVPINAGGLRRGARFKVVARFLGRDVPLVYRTVELDRPHRVVLEAENETLISRDTIDFSGRPDGGTRHLRRRPDTEGRVARRRAPHAPALPAGWRPRPRRARAGTGMSSQRIAVVGAGVSGLVAARELQRAGHTVSVFEAGDYAGGHTNTVEVESETGAWQVDTGFIVLNDRNYPNFERLLAELGVVTQPAPMSFSVSDGRGGFEWASRPRGVFAQGANLLDPRFHRMLLDWCASSATRAGSWGPAAAAVARRVSRAEQGYSDYFVERLILPQVSAIWSADPEQLWSFLRASWPSSSTNTAPCSSSAGRAGARSRAAPAVTSRR